MKRLYVLSGLVALTCLIGIYCSKKSSDPEPPPASSNAPLIDSLSGPYAWPDEQLTIYGLRFGDTQDSTRNVIIWPDTVDVISWSDTLIETDIPNNLGVTHVTVAADEDTSNAMSFSVFGITLVEPEYAHIGDTIRIHGLGFGVYQDSNTVLIGGKPAHIVSWYYTLIVAIVPEEAIWGNIEVTYGDHFSTWGPFDVAEVPYINAITPDWGTFYETVTITGGRLGSIPGDVFFNDTPATIYSWTDTEILTEFPFGSTDGELRVLNSVGTSNDLQFFVFGISHLEPNWVLPLDTILIHGTGFGEMQGSNNVIFNSDFLTDLSWSDELISVQAPENPDQGNVEVIIESHESNPALLNISTCEDVLYVLNQTNTVWVELNGLFDVEKCWFCPGCGNQISQIRSISCSNSRRMFGCYNCDSLAPVAWNTNSFSSALDTRDFEDHDPLYYLYGISGTVSQDGSSVIQVSASSEAGPAQIMWCGEFRSDLELNNIPLLEIDYINQRVVYGLSGPVVEYLVGQMYGQEMHMEVDYGDVMEPDFWYSVYSTYESIDWDNIENPPTIKIIFSIE